MINFDFSNDCYSCSACANVCPKDVIHFDRRLLPVVDTSVCVNCGRCERVCVNLLEKEYKPVLADNSKGVVCKNRNELERQSSSSGGIFILLANKILKLGGYVCGCVYDDCFMPKHIVSNDINDVKGMMGSKYVKSDMGFCIREIKQLLEEGIPVLFSGVPCQTAAISTSLGKQVKLFIVTLVCHGSIERDFWQMYLKEQEKYGSIKNVTMRDKSRGWENYGLKIRYTDGTERATYRNEDGYFLRSFTSGYFQRERCLKCKYKGSELIGDLLLGDGWGMDEVFPDLADSYGVSSAVLLSEKGERLFDEIACDIDFRTIDVSQIVYRNRRIISPAPGVALRRSFQSKCQKNPEEISRICKEYAVPSFTKKLINKINRGLCLFGK